MQKCALNGDLDVFQVCIQEESERTFPRDSRSESEKTWKGWTATPPESQSMSHIREQSFDLGKNLPFLGERVREDPEEFQYLIQTAFGAGESFVDADPWSHPVLRQEAIAAIREQMAAPENRRIMRAMMDFRDTQRLFRAALNGQLGDSFPLGRLADLMTALPARQNVKTEDWEPLGDGPGAGFQVEREMISRIEKLFQDAKALDPHLRSALVRCQSALRNDPAGTSTAGACDLSRVEETATDETRALVRNATRLEYARLLRAALGASRN